MITLTQEQKDDLKDLFTKPWFKVMEMLAKEMELDVFRMFKNIDIKNWKNLEILAKNTHYLKWIEDFIKTIKTQKNQISERKIDDESKIKEELES